MSDNDGGSDGGLGEGGYKSSQFSSGYLKTSSPFMESSSGSINVQLKIIFLTIIFYLNCKLIGNIVG